MPNFNSDFSVYTNSALDGEMYFISFIPSKPEFEKLYMLSKSNSLIEPNKSMLLELIIWNIRDESISSMSTNKRKLCNSIYKQLEKIKESKEYLMIASDIDMNEFFFSGFILDKSESKIYYVYVYNLEYASFLLTRTLMESQTE